MYRNGNKNECPMCSAIVFSLKKKLSRNGKQKEIEIKIITIYNTDDERLCNDRKPRKAPPLTA